jgi:hypothetical protein
MMAPSPRHIAVRSNLAPPIKLTFPRITGESTAKIALLGVDGKDK